MIAVGGNDVAVTRLSGVTGADQPARLEGASGDGGKHDQGQGPTAASRRTGWGHRGRAHSGETSVWAPSIQRMSGGPGGQKSLERLYFQRRASIVRAAT
jgi:hypothetical protein